MDKFKNKSIVLFDGVCNLCNNSVQFIIKRDLKKHFLYASLQSDAAKDLLLQYNVNNSQPESIILLKQDKVYYKSSAILEIFRGLGGLWPIFYGLIIIPKFIRDPIYNLIARHRYRWFGKRESCMVPTKELLTRFL